MPYPNHMTNHLSLYIHIDAVFHWFCSDPATEEEIEQDIIKSVDDEVKEKATFAPLASVHGDDVVTDASDKFQRLNLFFEQDKVSGVVPIAILNLR